MEGINIQGKKFYNVDTLAELLEFRCSPQTIRKLLKEDTIHGKKLGKYWFVEEEQVLKYLQGVEK